MPIRQILVLVLFVASLACGPKSSAGGGASNYTAQIAPTFSAAPSRQVLTADLTLVLDPRITESFRIERAQKKVVIDVTNFRSSLEATLIKALSPQFKSVVSGQETGKGLELVILSASYPEPVDVLAYHVALMKDGKLVHEVKDKTNPVSRRIATNVGVWQEAVKTMTVEILAENVTEASEKVRDQLVINDKLAEFWSPYRK